MVFDHSGAEVARHQLEHAQILPRPGWVEHDPAEIWERTRAVIEQALATGEPAHRRPGRPGPDQPAGDHAGVEPAHRAAVRPRDRVAGHQDRPDRRGPGPGRPGRRDQAQGRPAPGHLLLRRQAAVAARPRRRAARRRRTRRGHLRHRRHLAALEPHRRRPRRRARDRRHQRQPHHADGPADPGLGRRAARFLHRAASDAAADRAVLGPRTLRADSTRRPVRRPSADHRGPGRPAGGHRRPGLPGPGRGQEHLRHR